MKIVATSLAALALCLAATGAPAQDSRVSVVFAHPERYTDLRLSCVSRDADTRALTGELEALPAGGRRAPCARRASGSRSP